MEVMKRFTETAKWVDAWFHALPLDQKIAYLFILDQCDWGGVYEHSQSLAESMIGGRIDFDALVKNSGGRLVWLDEETKTHIWVVKFIEFQFNGVERLNPNHKPHIPAFKSIDKYGLRERSPALARGLVEAQQSLQDKDKDKDKDKSLGLPKDKGRRGNAFKKPTVDEIRAYCQERNNGLDAQAIYDHYEANGWKRGKTPVKDWKACVRTWEAKRREEQTDKVIPF